VHVHVVPTIQVHDFTNTGPVLGSRDTVDNIWAWDVAQFETLGGPTNVTYQLALGLGLLSQILLARDTKEVRYVMRSLFYLISPPALDGM
jgi:hypothetical protein